MANVAIAVVMPIFRSACRRVYRSRSNFCAFVSVTGAASGACASLTSFSGMCCFLLFDPVLLVGVCGLRG